MNIFTPSKHVLCCTLNVSYGNIYDIWDLSGLGANIFLIALNIVQVISSPLFVLGTDVLHFKGGFLVWSNRSEIWQIFLPLMRLSHFNVIPSNLTDLELGNILREDVVTLIEQWPSWWRHEMEAFSALLALCVENSPVTCEFPAQRPVTRSFDVFFIYAWIND